MIRWNHSQSFHHSCLISLNCDRTFCWQLKWRNESRDVNILELCIIPCLMSELQIFMFFSSISIEKRFKILFCLGTFMSEFIHRGGSCLGDEIAWTCPGSCHVKIEFISNPTQRRVSKKYQNYRNSSFEKEIVTMKSKIQE